MSNNILELDSIRVNMLVTPSMHPLPEEAVIAQNLGKETMVFTDENGAVQNTVKGDHMILVFDAIDFANWVGENVFYLFNPESDQFQATRLKRSA